MLDIDHFKQVNDTFGHPVGDEILASVGVVLSRKARRGDLVARVGGEEFAVLLPDTSEERAGFVAERIRAEIASAPLGATTKVLLTISIGLATHRPNVDSAEALVKAADLALYAAKTAGRNRVGS
jgi:diguanylate cyclase (GGDEF)-like protein